jgi:lysine-N-methylase
MKSPRIELPTIQNWSCHGCSDCCRNQLLVVLSPEEQQRIKAQEWTPTDGVDSAAMLVAEGKSVRLGHQSNGACVFLDPSNRCRIHAKFGEAAKPLACRLYPFVIHPAGRKVVVGLRFSCPSVVANRGLPLAVQRKEIQQLANAVVGNNYDEGTPPPVLATRGLAWPDFLRFVNRLDASLAVEHEPVALKLMRALHWLGTVEQGQLDQIAGAGAEEILDTLVQNAARNLSALPDNFPPPSGFGRLFLRLLVLEHARSVTVEDACHPGRHRWKMLWAGLRLARARGCTPALRDGLARVPFATVEQPSGPLSLVMEAMLTRYFRVKIQSLHFCGRAFHDRPLIEGFRSLALLYPVIIWISRWLAASERRVQLTEADVARALSMVDYHYSYSPYQSWRIRLLAQRGDIARLCGTYAR